MSFSSYPIYVSFYKTISNGDEVNNQTYNFIIMAIIHLTLLLYA